jgi:GPH family glycoside/pentoside/hexuronide:cation symporter
LFSAYSFLTICLYAQGVRKGEGLGPRGHIRLAAWRESGMVIGVCLAAVAPAVLAFGPNPPFQSFAVLFAALAVGAGWMMRHAWAGGGAVDAAQPGLGAFAAVLRDAVARRLLVVALLNAAPVAVSSTLFLFYVESRLAAPGWEGPLLLLFFLSAAAAVPVWAQLAAKLGEKRVLTGAMGLAVIAFSFAALLGPGDAPAFALVCIASGAAIGADLTLLPAIFARRMAQVSPDATAGFALWAFVTKATLAIAALVVLPALDWAGFDGPTSAPSALLALGLTYALLPCVLKLAAIALLASTDLERDPVHV